MQLTYRERWMTVGLIAFLALWALYALGVRPAAERLETLKRVIPEKRQVLDELRAKSAQYLAMQAQLDGFKQRALLESKDFEPLRFLESTVNQMSLAKQLSSMKQEVLQLDSSYCEVIVEIKLETITLKQLIELLLKVRTSSYPLRIRSLYTKKNTANPELLDTLIQISALKISAPI